MDNVFDKMFYNKGTFIGGIDESGVSDLAGPLIAACVVLPKLDIHQDDVQIFNIDDSKKLNTSLRAKYASLIWEKAIGIGVGEVNSDEIDFFGHQKAIVLAHTRAVLACKKPMSKVVIKPDFLLIDGKYENSLQISYKNIPNGDAVSLSIAAASIVAKVYRDDLMVKLHERYPWYGWDRNKGFRTEEHYQGIDNQGIVLGVHRVRYWPIFADPYYRKQTPIQELINWERRRKLWKNRTFLKSL